MSTTISLRDLGLSPGQAAHREFDIELVPYVQAGEPYVVSSETVPARLDITAMDEGWSFHLRFQGEYVGPCSRCLEPAMFNAIIDAHEIHDPAIEPDSEDADQLRSDHVDDVANELDVSSWAQEAVALRFPTRVLCRPDCRGLCAQCGENLNEHPEHEHEQPTDSRWDALKNLQVEGDDG